MKEKYLHSHLTQEIIGSAMRIHSALGPGLLESAYEDCLEYELKKTGLLVERQIPVGIEYESLTVETAYRLDLLVEKKVIVELKAVRELIDVHEAQILTYLRFSGVKVGLLINFNEVKLKNGIRRFVL